MYGNIWWSCSCVYWSAFQLENSTARERNKYFVEEDKKKKNRNTKRIESTDFNNNICFHLN